MCVYSRCTDSTATTRTVQPSSGNANSFSHRHDTDSLAFAFASASNASSHTSTWVHPTRHKRDGKAPERRPDEEEAFGGDHTTCEKMSLLALCISCRRDHLHVGQKTHGKKAFDAKDCYSY